jgi:hypothetical protein
VSHHAPAWLGQAERGQLKGERVKHARFLVVVLAALAALVAVGAASASTITKDATSGGTILVPNAPAPRAGTGGGLPEIDSSSAENDVAVDGASVNRGNSRFDRHGRHGDHGRGANPRLGVSFDGLNFFAQRFANGGNQFSVEPPDQGLCVGNGKVVEVVNDVYQVFDMRGHALINPVDLNTLFGYSPAIVRSGPNAGQQGADVFDPSCLFDQQTGRFFIVASTLDRVSPTNHAEPGTSHIDILVAGDPTKSLTKYSIDTTRDAPCFNDGAQTKPGPCFPDYPHIGADRNGFYITTNVFDFFGPGFEGVNIYAMSKFVLASGAFTLPVTVTSTNGVGPADDGGTGFTVIPAVSPGADQFSGERGGTEYFVSSRAVFTSDGTSTSLVVWNLSNTRSLNSATPNLKLTSSLVNTSEYGVPAPATQKSGDAPVAQCLGSTLVVPATGQPCWLALNGTFGFGKPVTLGVQTLDSNDSRIGGVSFANGKLWATLGSAATDSAGNPTDGVAWFVLNPHGSSADLTNEGMLVRDGANLTYPSLAVTEGGQGAMGFTITGPNDFPSAGFVGLDSRSGTGDVQYAARGKGPQDGFTEYIDFGTPSFRPRWGDYGAAVADGGSIWVAAEYIGQTCTLAQYVQASPTNVAAFGTCNDTRGSLGNWDTRISQLLVGH